MADAPINVTKVTVNPAARPGSASGISTSLTVVAVAAHRPRRLDQAGIDLAERQLGDARVIGDRRDRQGRDGGGDANARPKIERRPHIARTASAKEIGWRSADFAGEVIARFLVLERRIVSRRRNDNLFKPSFLSIEYFLHLCHAKLADHEIARPIAPAAAAALLS
jgi:hypothetical protein